MRAARWGTPVGTTRGSKSANQLLELFDRIDFGKHWDHSVMESCKNAVCLLILEGLTGPALGYLTLVALLGDNVSTMLLAFFDRKDTDYCIEILPFQANCGTGCRHNLFPIFDFLFLN